MAVTESQKPVCPLCRRSDQVQTLQAAYASGIERFAPPAMPVGRVPMMKFMLIGFALITLCAFFIIVLLGPDMPDYVRYIQAFLSIVAIIVALWLSLLAFLRAVRGDLKSQQLLPAWDQAIANWSRLRYCKRDNVVFDPQQVVPKPLTESELASLLSVTATPEQAAQTTAQVAQRPS